MYFLRIPKMMRWLFPKAIFDFSKQSSQKIYLTFDDGPNPNITPFVLEQLDKFQAKATFFMVGQNVQKYPLIFEAIKNAHHQIGNHTNSHLNGMKTKLQHYLEDIAVARQSIDSDYFRPPYGRLSRVQLKALQQQGYKVVMWSLLSGDFDAEISPEDCLNNVLNNIRVNDIIVFHDSDKASEKLRYVLPKVLAYCQEKGWEMATLS